MTNQTSVVLLVAVLVTLGAAAPRPASALTAELAKKCRELAFKAHPPDPVGSTKGSSRGQRAYYEDCLKKGGNMEGDEPKK